jgi:arginine utilization protein RocB
MRREFIAARTRTLTNRREKMQKIQNLSGCPSTERSLTNRIGSLHYLFIAGNKFAGINNEFQSKWTFSVRLVVIILPRLIAIIKEAVIELIFLSPQKIVFFFLSLPPPSRELSAQQQKLKYCEIPKKNTKNCKKKRRRV